VKSKQLPHQRKTSDDPLTANTTPPPLTPPTLHDLRPREHWVGLEKVLCDVNSELLGGGRRRALENNTMVVVVSGGS
jgi:hypothetical protein